MPDALGRMGHRVTLVIPRYRGVDVSGAHAETATVQFGERQVEVTFYTGVPRNGVTPVFVDAAGLYDRDGLY